MDPAFVARLERQARAKHGLPPSWNDVDISMHPPLSPTSNTSYHSPSHPPDDPSPGDDEEDEEEEEEDEDDDDHVLRAFGEVPAEMDDHNLPLVLPSKLISNEFEDHSLPNDEAEDEEDDGTSDSEEETRPKKPPVIPTIRLKLNLPTQLPLPTSEQSVSLLAKHAGYQLPADTAITFGASSAPEPELPQSSHVPFVDMPPPTKRRRRRRIQERDEGYDKDDPFVDDSEAFIMEPKYYYPPARDGFFAATGRLELKSDLKKSKTRKTTLKAPTADPPKVKRRVPLTTISESSSTGPKPPLKPTSHSKTPAQQALPTDTQHQVSAPPPRNPGSSSDSQLAPQSQNLVTQTPLKASHTPQQAIFDSKNPAQQSLSNTVVTNSQSTSKLPNPTPQTQSKGHNTDYQTNSPSQNLNAAPQPLAEGSTTLQHQIGESQKPPHLIQPNASTRDPQLVSQTQDPSKETQAKSPTANHQPNFQSTKPAQHTVAQTSSTIQNHPSPSPVQQTQTQGSNLNQQTQASYQSSALTQLIQAQAPVSNQNSGFSKVPPLSSPKAIKTERTSGKIQPLPQLFTNSHAGTSQASPQSLASSLHQFGTPLNPISLIDDDDPSYTSSVRPNLSPFNQSVNITSSPSSLNQSSQHPRPPYLKSRSLPERRTAGPLPPILEQALEQLKVKIEAASPFVPKKFPPELKPFTLEVAEMALDLNEYDECFFIRLAQLFPYNTFTIKKFVKREILPRRKLYYESQINQRIGRLEGMIAEGMPSAREEYEQAMQEYRQAMLEYEKRQEARRSQEESTTALPANASTILSHTVTKSPFNAPIQKSTEVPDKMPKLPSKLFKLTQPMREILYELVKLEDEQSETVKDTQKITDKTVTLKDTSNRRQFFSKLAHLWPDDFMSSTRLSHIVGSMKKRYEGNTPIGPQNLITLS